MSVIMEREFKMRLKLLNINIWNYHDFDTRKPKIIALIKKYDPDVVVFQEIRDDRSKNKIGEHQLVQLNQELKYPYSYFLPVQDFREKEKKLHECIEGLGICSKYPFETNATTLKKQKDDKFTRKVLHASVHVNNMVLNIHNVHFSPNDVFARLQLEEVLKMQENKMKSIIVGDLNYAHPDIIANLAEKNGFIASSHFNYVSYPDDDCSYDYILLSHDMTFGTFVCVQEKVSDHRALYAEITL